MTKIKTPTTYLEPVTIHRSCAHPYGTSLDCKFVLNIGLFFDGTGNNSKFDKPNFEHSNVACLYEAYRNEPRRGYFSHYIQGVGTPFPEIGEHGKSTFGSAFAAGGEARAVGHRLRISELTTGSKTGVTLSRCTKPGPAFRSTASETKTASTRPMARKSFTRPVTAASVVAIGRKNRGAA